MQLTFALAWFWHQREKEALDLLLGIHVTPLFFTDLFPISCPLSYSLSPHVMSPHRSLATGRKPEPLAGCRSERRRGYILLADAK